jgi:hypothetical protein
MEIPAPQQLHHPAQKLHRIDSPICRIGVGEMLSDITECSGAEKRIAERVKKHIAVGMSDRPGLGFRNIDSAEPHRPSRFEPVYVVAETGSQSVRCKV